MSGNVLCLQEIKLVRLQARAALDGLKANSASSSSPPAEGSKQSTHQTDESHQDEPGPPPPLFLNEDLEDTGEPMEEGQDYQVTAQVGHLFLIETHFHRGFSGRL